PITPVSGSTITLGVAPRATSAPPSAARTTSRRTFVIPPPVPRGTRCGRQLSQEFGGKDFSALAWQRLRVNAAARGHLAADRRERRAVERAGGEREHVALLARDVAAVGHAHPLDFRRRKIAADAGDDAGELRSQTAPGAVEFEVVILERGDRELD